MTWHVTYYSKAVEEGVLQLPKTLLARYLRIIDLMLTHGPHLEEPHTKFLGDGLIELRLKGQEGIARVFYGVVLAKEIVILHSFIKKTQKIPLRELTLAKKRYKEIKHDIPT